MIHDALLLFSDAQAITAAAASTNSIDLGAARDIGTGQALYVVITVDTAFTDSGSDSSVTVDMYGDSTSSFTPDGTQRLTIIPALAAAGSIYVCRIDPDFAANFRFVELFYTPNNGNLSTGAVTAEIVLDPQKYTSFAKGYTIS